METTRIDDFVYEYVTRRAIRLDQALPYTLTRAGLEELAMVGPLTRADFLGFLQSYVYSSEVVELFHVYFYGYVHYHIQEPLAEDQWALSIIREHLPVPVRQKVLQRIGQILEYKRDLNELTPSYHALAAFFERLQK